MHSSSDSHTAAEGPAYFDSELKLQPSQAASRSRASGSVSIDDAGTLSRIVEAFGAADRPQLMQSSHTHAHILPIANRFLNTRPFRLTSE